MKRSVLEQKFQLTWDARCLERSDVDESRMVLIPELQFAKPLGRKFRFDFAHASSRTAIEIQGGVYNRGAHVRPEGYRNDCEKALIARELMWTTVALTTDMITDLYVDRIIDLCLSRNFIAGPTCDYVIAHTSPNGFPAAYHQGELLIAQRYANGKKQPEQKGN